MQKRSASRNARRRPRQRRALQTVEAVLDAVGRILKRGGARAVTTNRIAEVAGVSIGSVYQYFPDKEAIFAALHDRHVDEMGRIVDAELIDHAAAPLDERVSALVEAMVAAHAADPVLHEQLFTQVPHRVHGGAPGRAHGPGRAYGIDGRLHSALRLTLGSGPQNLEAGRDLDRTLFVLTHMIESLSHGAVLGRPPGLSLAAATKEAIRAVLAYLHA